MADVLQLVSAKSSSLAASNDYSPKRTSSLMAPNMELRGHGGEIYTTQFSNDGTFLATAGYDMQIFLWNVYGECENFAVLKGHRGAIMELKFNSDSSHLITASVDKTIRIWDMESGVCIRNFKSHSDFVNSIDVSRRGPEMICSAGDDGLVMIHDFRSKSAVRSFENKYQQTAVVFSDGSESVICGGLDNTIKIWDILRDDVRATLKGHADTITGLSVSNNGNFLLSNSMDCTVRKWDIRPFVAGDRSLAVYCGIMHNFEKNLLRCSWSPNDKCVTAGSADRFAYVWDANSRRCLYKLPGHMGSVNATAFHPIEPIFSSVGSDKRILLGELALDDY